MLEVVIVAICVQGPGCVPALQSYYAYSPEFKHVVDTVEAYRQHVPQVVVGAAMLASGGTYILPVHGGLTVALSSSSFAVNFGKGF